jgi:hypothetical protein
MKILTIKTSICALFVGLFVLAESNVQGQEAIFGTCVSSDQAAPTPNCANGPFPASTSISWVTGTFSCNGYVFAHSECWNTTITNAIQHTEPVTWSSRLDHGGDATDYTDPEGVKVWVYPPYVPNGNAFCVNFAGYGVDPVGQYPWEVYSLSNYTLGSDTQTAVSGSGCSEIDL